MKYLVSTLASAVTLLIMTGGPLAQDYSPYAQRTYPIRVFWATRTCTPIIRTTPPDSARQSDRRTPIAWPAANK